MVETRKKKRVSKKSKRSWRKHVDIGDVENFLEDQRLEERVGTKLSEATNNELFQIDTAGKSTQLLSKKQKREMILRSIPKCFAMLQSYSEVPDPITKRNRVRSKEERKDAILKKKEAAKRAQGIFPKSELQSINDRRKHEELRKLNSTKDKFDMDIWNSERKEKVLNNDWITEETKKHTLSGLGKMQKSVPKALRQKKSIVPAVEVPHPGTSYNPSYKDHQALLKEIVDQEVKVIKEEEHINRVTQNMYKRISASQHQNAWFEEMSQGIPKPDEKQESETEDTKTSISVNPAVTNKKKTLKQKRKQREQLALEAARRRAKSEKKMITDIHKLKFLEKSIQKEEEKARLLGEKRKKKQNYKLKEAKRLGATKFEEANVDFNLGEDISGRLSNMKKEGNLLYDRYKSMQKRNIIEPSVKRLVKKAKIKRYKKPDHKDNWKSTVAGVK